MSIQPRTAASPLAALALATALLAPPAVAQDYQQRRPPQQHGPRAAQAPRPAAPYAAQQPRRGGDGGKVAAGVIGGLAAGAILGGILSNGAAARPAPVEEVDPGCPLVRRPVYDGAGQFAGYQAVPSC